MACKHKSFARMLLDFGKGRTKLVQQFSGNMFIGEASGSKVIENCLLSPEKGNFAV